MFRSGKGFEQQKDALTLHNGIIFRGVVPFIPPKLRHLVLAKAHETHPGKNATEASFRMIELWPGITQDVQHFVSRCKNCQMNGPSLEKHSLLGQKPTFGNGSTWTVILL